ncbi:MAG TPA: hypothetical protein ENN34_04435 [Deltaproteobacteria bacterium]|nr:hypothetical protein [Deltaproteobacteria bacterium]
MPGKWAASHTPSAMDSIRPGIFNKGTPVNKEANHMDLHSTFRFFREDACDRCGICFERCPVL